jgi:orotidine-5'-phosphate decarboxylase
MSANPRIIVALDFPSRERALELVTALSPAQCRLKVGKELFTAAGPALVETLAARGFEVFLDLKYHDIPNTVAAACSRAVDLGVWMLNVHALGGRRMLEAARGAITGPNAPLLMAVTVLTSMTEADLVEVGITERAETLVERLGRLAMACGLDGLVCSAQETSRLRQVLGERPVLVTPGIRPAGTDAGDQRRIVTPRQALKQGSSYLVIGRPVTASADPAAALDGIITDLGDLA